MTSDQDVLALLRQAIERVGTENLVRRPGLARNVFGDMFPADPLVVSLLSAAVESGAVGRLRDDSADDVGIVAPRLADGLASSRGIVPQHARWAVDMWAFALGRSDRMPVPLGQSDPVVGSAAARRAADPDQPTLPADQATETAPSDGTETRPLQDGPSASTGSVTAARPGGVPDEESVTRLAPAAAGAGPTGSRSQMETERLSAPPEPKRRQRKAAAAATATAAAVATPAPGDGAPPPRKPRRKLGAVPIVAAVAVAVLVIGISTAVLVSTNRPAAPKNHLDHAMSAMVLAAKDGAAATLAVGHSHQDLAQKPVSLHDGDSVTVTKGPVELAFGKSLVRLGSGTGMSLKAATKQDAAQLGISVSGGDEADLYASIAAGQTLNVEPAAGQEHFVLTGGRFAMTCSTTCTYYTLDERQQMHVGSSMTPVPMAPHRRLRASESAGTGMDMNHSTPSPSASASASPDQMGMSMPMPTGTASTGSSAESTQVALTADYLRYVPWIKQNLASDVTERRPFLNVSGPKLVGTTWTFMLERKDVPAPVHRTVTFGTSHCTQPWGWGCVITAHSTYRDQSGKLKELKGNVEGAGRDAGVDAVKIAYSAVPAACAAFGTADGMQAIVDSVDFSTNPGSGERRTTYTADSGTHCDKSQLPTASITAAPGGITKADFTSPGAGEDLVLEHVIRGTCSESKASFNGLASDASCDLHTLDAGNPASIQLYTFTDVDSLRNAYNDHYRQ